MLARLFLLFVLTCAAELGLLLWFADRFGWRVALGEVLLTALLGLLLLRWQSQVTRRRMQSQLAAGQLSASEATHGLVVILVGVLLILPGLLTDSLGLLLLIPLFRRLLGLGIVAWLYRYWRLASFASSAHYGEPPTSKRQMPRILDAQVVERGAAETRDDE